MVPTVFGLLTLPIWLPAFLLVTFSLGWDGPEGGRESCFPAELFKLPVRTVRGGLADGLWSDCGLSALAGRGLVYSAALDEFLGRAPFRCGGRPDVGCSGPGMNPGPTLVAVRVALALRLVVMVFSFPA